VSVHAAACVRGPQGGPAGAHGSDQRSLIVDAQKALELTGEIAALAILDQGGGAHGARPRACRALRLPSGEQRREDWRRDRPLVKGEPNVDREAALLDAIGCGEAADDRLQSEGGDLCAIGIRAEAEAARRRQPRLAQCGEIGRLRADALGVAGASISKRDDELRHERVPRSSRVSTNAVSRRPRLWV